MVKLNEKENSIEQDHYNEYDFLISKTICHYDENGNLIEQIFYDNKGNSNGRWLWKYDNQGNEIEFQAYSSIGSLYENDSYRYEKFDDHGNWLLKICGGTITERKIEYY